MPNYWSDINILHAAILDKKNVFGLYTKMSNNIISGPTSYMRPIFSK